jgi:uncharacterized membrane protein YeaQ/YmgE (transglycosylase-associated protein family)
MIGAILLGLVAGTVGPLLVPDMWSELSGPRSWLFSLVVGPAGAMLGYLIFTVWLGLARRSLPRPQRLGQGPRTSRGPAAAAAAVWARPAGHRAGAARTRRHVAPLMRRFPE